jgi:hypothetical protein
VPAKGPSTSLYLICALTDFLSSPFLNHPRLYQDIVHSHLSFLLAHHMQSPLSSNSSSTSETTLSLLSALFSFFIPFLYFYHSSTLSFLSSISSFITSANIGCTLVDFASSTSAPADPFSTESSSFSASSSSLRVFDALIKSLKNYVRIPALIIFVCKFLTELENKEKLKQSQQNCGTKKSLSIGDGFGLFSADVGDLDFLSLHW